MQNVETTTGTMRGFVSRYGVRMTVEWADDNPHMADTIPGASHWKCCLRCDGRQLTVHFSMGPALSGEPSVEDLLDCLASDASGAENAGSFEEWAGEYGYDTDSRQAERTYHTIERQAAGLKRLVGEDAYRELLWGTERD